MPAQVLQNTQITGLGGGGDSHMKMTGMLVGKLELTP